MARLAAFSSNNEGEWEMDKKQITLGKLLLLKAIINGKARWEFLSNSVTSGEVCFGGLRYLVQIDEKDGCPALYEEVYERLLKHVYNT